MVQARDIGAGHRGDREPAERRDNDPVHNLAVLLVRAGLVVFRRMLAEITDGELGDGRRCARLAPHAGRVFSSSDLGEQPPRFFARFVGGHHAVLGDRQPFRLAMPIAVLQDIGLHAARLDPQAEPGELVIPHNDIGTAALGGPDGADCQFCHGAAGSGQQQRGATS